MLSLEHAWGVSELLNVTLMSVEKTSEIPLTSYSLVHLIFGVANLHILHPECRAKPPPRHITQLCTRCMREVAEIFDNGAPDDLAGYTRP